MEINWSVSVISVLTLIYSNEGGNASKPAMYMCGYPTPKRYNPLHYGCKEGHIVPRITTTPQPPVTSQPDCQEKTLHKKARTKCCGPLTFVPRHQTCCMTVGSQWKRWKVHNKKPARKHICCGLRVYKRYNLHKIPCLHPVNNNRFWSASPFTKQNIGNHCQKNQNAAIVVLLKQTENNETHYVAYAFSIPINPKGKATPYRQLNVPIDQHRRRRNLDRETFLVLSPVADPLKDAPGLILNPKDVIFRLPKRLKKRKRLLYKCGLPLKRLVRFRKRVIRTKSACG